MEYNFEIFCVIKIWRFLKNEMVIENCWENLIEIMTIVRLWQQYCKQLQWALYLFSMQCG